MTRLVVCGLRGRMGSALRQIALERDDVRIVAGLGREAGDLDGIPVHTMDNCADALADADVTVDFSTAGATRELLERCRAALAGRALVVGTTGLDAATHEMLQAAAADTAVLTASNFSIGVNLLMALTRQAAAALSAGEWDIEIVEAHHRQKVDAPSGTALSLANAAAEGRQVDLASVRCDGRSGETGARPRGEIGIHAVRGGGVVGDHQVHFLAGREQVTLHHRAMERAVFADGALRAALWVNGRAPGLYGMNDVLGLGS